MSTPAGPEGSGPEISAEETQEIRSLLEEELQNLTTVEPDEAGIFPISEKSLESSMEQLADKTGPLFQTATLFLNIIKKQEIVTDKVILTFLTQYVLGEISNWASNEAVIEDLDESNTEDNKKTVIRGLITGIMTALAHPKVDLEEAEEDSIDDSSMPLTPPLYTGSSDAGGSPGTTSIDPEAPAGELREAARDLTDELAAAAEPEDEKPAAPPTYYDVSRVNASIAATFELYAKQEENKERIGNINLFIERLAEIVQSLNPQRYLGYGRRAAVTTPIIKSLTDKDIKNFEFLLDTWKILSGKKIITLSDLQEGKQESAAAGIFKYFHHKDEEQQQLDILSNLIGDSGLFYHLQRLDQIVLFRSVIHEPLPESPYLFSQQQKAKYHSELATRYQRIEELLAVLEVGRVSTDNSIRNYKLLLDILTDQTDIAEHLDNEEIPIANLLELFQHHGTTSTNQEKLIDLVNKLLKLDVITIENITTVILEATNPVILPPLTYTDLFRLTDDERDYRIRDDELRRRLQSARYDLESEKRWRSAIGLKLTHSEKDRSRLTVLSQTLERKYDELVRQVEALKQARGEAYLELPEVAKDRISDLEASNKELVAEINNLRKELALAQKTIDEKEDEIIQREEQKGIVERLRYRLREASGTIQSLSAHHQVLQAQFAGLNDEKQQAEKASERLNQTIAALKLAVERSEEKQFELADAAQEAERLRALNEQLAATNRHLLGIKQELTTTEKQLEQVRENLDSEKRKTTELQQRLLAERQTYTAQLIAQKEKLAGETHTITVEAASIREQVSIQTVTIADLEKQLTTAKAEIEQLKAEVSTTVEREALVSAREQELEIILRQQEEKYKQELKQQQELFADELAQANASAEAAKTQSAALQLKIDGQELQVSELKQQLAHSNLDREALSKKIADLELHSASTLDESSEEIAKLQLVVVEKDSEIEKISLALAKTNDELEQLRFHIKTLDQKAALAERNAASTKVELDNVRAELKTQQESHAQQLRLQQEKSAQDLSAARADTAALSAIAGELRLQLDEKTANIAQLEIKLRDKDARVQEISETLKALQKTSAGSQEAVAATIAELNRKLLEQQALVKKLAEDKSSEEASLAALKLKLTELENELESYKARAMTAETKLEELNTELQAAKKEFDAERAGLRAELDASITQHRLEVEGFEDTVAKTTKELAEKIQSIEKLEARVARLNAENEGGRADLSKTISELTREKSALEQEVADLRLARARLQEQLTAAQDGYDRALAEQSAAFEREKERLVCDLATKQGELDTTLLRHSRQLEALQQAMTILQQQRDEVTSQADIAEQDHLAAVAKLRSDLESSEDNLQRLKAEQDACAKQLAELNTVKHSALLAQVEWEQQRALAAEAQITRLQAVVGEQSSELEAARSTVEDAAARLSVAQKQHTDELARLEKEHASKMRLSDRKISNLEGEKKLLVEELLRARLKLEEAMGHIDRILPEEIDRVIAEYKQNVEAGRRAKTERIGTLSESMVKLQVAIPARFAAFKIEKTRLEASIESLKRQLDANARKTEEELTTKNAAIVAQERLITQALEANTALREEYQTATAAVIAERDATVRSVEANAALIAKKAEDFERFLAFGHTELLAAYEQKTGMLIASGIELAAKQLGLAEDRRIVVEGQLVELNKQKDSLVTYAAGLDAEIGELKQRALAQETRERASVAALAAARLLTDTQRQELAALRESSIKQLAEKNTEHQNIITGLRSRIASLESEGEGKESEVAALEQRIQELEAAHAAKLAEIESRNAVAAVLETRVAEQEARVEELELANASLTTDNATAQEQIARLQEQAVLRRRINTRRTATVRDSQQSLEQKDARIDQLERENETLRGRITEYEAKEQALAAELAATKELIATREQALAQLQREFAEQLETITSTHKSTIADLENQIATIKSQGEEKAGEVVTLLQRIADLARSHEETLAQMQSAHAAAVAELETTVDKQTRRIGELERTIDSISAEKTAAQDRIRRLELLIGARGRVNSSNRAKVQELLQSLQIRDAQIAELTAQRDATTHDRDQDAITRIQIAEDLARETKSRELGDWIIAAHVRMIEEKDQMIARLLAEIARLRAEFGSKAANEAEQEAALSAARDENTRLAALLATSQAENERLARELAALKAEPKVDAAAVGADSPDPEPASPSPAIATPTPPTPTAIPEAASWGERMVGTVVGYLRSAMSRSPSPEAGAVTSPFLADLEVEVDLDPPAPDHHIDPASAIVEPASPLADLRVEAGLEASTTSTALQDSSGRPRPAPLSPEVLRGPNSGSLTFGAPLAATPSAEVGPTSSAATPAEPTFATPLSSPAVGTPGATADTLGTPLGGRDRRVRFGDHALSPSAPAAAPTTAPPTDAAQASTADLAPASAVIPPIATHEVFTSAHVKQDPYFASVAPESKVLKVTAPKIKVDATTPALEKHHRKTALALEIFLMTYLAGSCKGHPPVLRVKGADPELVALYCAFVELFRDAGLQSTFTKPDLVSEDNVGEAKAMIQECFDISAAVGIASAGLDKSVVDLIISLYLSGGKSSQTQYQRYVSEKMGWIETEPVWDKNSGLFSGRHADAMSSEELLPVFIQPLSKIISTSAEDYTDDADYTVLQKTLMQVNGIDHTTPGSRGTPRR